MMLRHHCSTNTKPTGECMVLAELHPNRHGGLLRRRIWFQVTNTYGHEYLHRPDLTLLRWALP